MSPPKTGDFRGVLLAPDAPSPEEDNPPPKKLRGVRGGAADLAGLALVQHRQLRQLLFPTLGLANPSPNCMARGRGRFAKPW